MTEYSAGAGRHRVAGVFGDAVGVSLLSTCRFRFRRGSGAKWERAAINLEPRSTYLLRDSMTFRTLRGDG